MSTDPGTAGDQRLNHLIQSWRLANPLPPGFEDGVWKQISRETERPEPAWRQWRDAVTAGWRALLLQPAGATAYLLALLVMGAGLGYWKSEQATSRVETEWRSAYIHSVNPASHSLEE